MDLSDANLQIVLRLGAAVLVGGLVGLDRELHRKVVGLRTSALVTLAAAMAVLALYGLGQPGEMDVNAVSRIVQGVLTGVGFLGAGVIMRDTSGHVTGLTTATMIWVSAALGVLCGLGRWTILLTALVLVLIVLVLGRRVDRLVQRFTAPTPPD
ncbi:MAG: MgtC/SapB family protein [Acidobacteriota bacterium]